MNLIEIDILPEGSAVVNVDQITMVAKTSEGVTRINFSGAGHLDVPYDLRQVQNALAGRDSNDDGTKGGFAFA